MQKNKRIIFTGGHHNSALVLAKKLKDRGFSILWLGHKYTMSKDKTLSAEYREVTNAGIDFVNLKTGKFYKTLNPLKHLKVVLGFFHSFYILITKRPKVIVSFGGYLAFPVVIVGRFLGIDSVTHEQTVTAGIANQIVSRFVKRVYLTWKDSESFFSSSKTKVVGLPLRRVFKKKPKAYEFDNDKKTILVLGGKQGAHVINKAIEKNLEYLLSKYNLIHQCGYNKETDDYERILNKKEKLENSQNYILGPYFFAQEIVKAYYSADLVICRSGAHTVYELAYMQKPAILIPYPYANRKEQHKNANLLADKKAALILEQKDLDQIVKTIDSVFKDYNSFSKKAQNTKKLIKTDATEVMLQDILSLLS